MHFTVVGFVSLSEREAKVDHVLIKTSLLFLWKQAFFKNTIILFDVPQFCISIVFNFSRDLQSPQEKFKKMLMQTFGGTSKSIIVFLKKVHYSWTS